jgi:hypothetical protein
MATTVFIRVFGDRSFWLSRSMAKMPAAIRLDRDSASRSLLADERTHTTR